MRRGVPAAAGADDPGLIAETGHRECAFRPSRSMPQKSTVNLLPSALNMTSWSALTRTPWRSGEQRRGEGEARVACQSLLA
jgi:hypothetical protein